MTGWVERRAPRMLADAAGETGARTATEPRSDAAGQGSCEGTRSSRPAPAADRRAEPACRSLLHQLFGPGKRRPRITARPKDLKLRGLRTLVTWRAVRYAITMRYPDGGRAPSISERQNDSTVRNRPGMFPSSRPQLAERACGPVPGPQATARCQVRRVRAWPRPEMSSSARSHPASSSIEPSKRWKPRRKSP